MYKLSSIILKIITAIILAAITICTTAIIFFTYTNSGFYYLTKSISFYYNKDITISKTNGTLADGIKVSKATIADKNLQITFTNSYIKYSLFDIPELYIGKTDLEYDSLKVALTDIKVTKDYNVSFKIPKHKIRSNTKLLKKQSGYQITTNISFSDKNITLTGKANQNSLSLKNTPDSIIDTTIYLNWQEHLKWDIKAYNNKSSAIEKLYFTSKGSLSDFSLKLNTLKGIIADKQLDAKISYNKNVKHQKLNTDITYGDSKAVISLDSGDDIDLKAHIITPNLSEIMPELLGSVTADINIAGANAAININAQNVFHSSFSVDKLAANILLNNEIKANIDASGARYHSIYKKHADMDISGNLVKHIIKISSNSDTNFSSTLEGSYSNKNWSAKILDLALDDKNSSLKLASTDTITANSNSISNQSLCLSHNNNSICTKFAMNIEDNTWSAGFNSEKFDLKDLSPLNLFSNNVDIKSGSLTGNMTLNKKKPHAVSQQGHLDIKNAKLYLKEQNIHPTLANLHIKSKNYTTNLEGNLISENNNKAKFSGVIRTNKGVIAKAKIKGNNFLVHNTQNLKLIVSPDISMLLHNYLDVNGTIDVIDTKINIQDSDEVKLPSDVIIANNYSADEPDLIVLGPKTHLNLNLLDNIDVHMQKIHSKIKGSLVLNAKNDGQVLVTGTIHTYDGSFSGYGHKLDIDHGKLVYDKDPIDSPWLNIEATRSINLDSSDDIRSLEKIIVGIIISGNISNPEITLFSNPNKYTENEILSLILTGSLTSMLNEENDMDKKSDNFYSMLIGKSLIQSMGVLNQLSDKLSLNQITIGGAISDSQTKSNSQSPINITMSKNISPKLRLIGTFGIYSDDYSLSAIYNINKNVMLKGYVNQLSNGLNMLYKFHTD